MPYNKFLSLKMVSTEIKIQLFFFLQFPFSLFGETRSHMHQGFQSLDFQSYSPKISFTNSSHASSSTTSCELRDESLSYY